MELFPEGHVINIIPWEHNEVPVLIAAAMATDQHIVALHLTRPPIQVPDREALGIASHFEAAQGAYLIRDYAAGQPRMGTILVQGTMSTYNVVRLLPKLDELGLNVKIVAAVSPELFRLQPEAYRESRFFRPRDQMDMTYITNGSRRLMRDWVSTALPTSMRCPLIGTIAGGPGARWTKCWRRRTCPGTGCCEGSSALWRSGRHGSTAWVPTWPPRGGK